MGKILYFFYRHFFVKILLVSVWMLTPFIKKLKLRRIEEKKCREDCLENLWKKKGQKRILFHCSSLGEWEQAAPVVEIIKKQNPQIGIVVSFFSISGYNHVKDNPYINGKVFLPFDSYDRAIRFFEHIKPDLWIISAYDVWPNHVMASKKLKIPTVIISATLSSASTRNKGISGALNKFVFKNIHAIYSRSSSDTKRFLEIYPYPEKLKTFGDTRADRVYEKSVAIRKERDLLIFKTMEENDLVFIAGSSWPADEKAILPGITALMRKYVNLKAIIVPHEIKEDHICQIERFFQKEGFQSERYSTIKGTDGSHEKVVIVDAIGLLAKLYKMANVAYIGGSFGKGVHNVLEPSVFGLPVLFGPKHLNSQEAIHLKDEGVAFCINKTEDFLTIMEKIITNNDFRAECSLKTIQYIKNNLGASGKIYQHLSMIIDFIN